MGTFILQHQDCPYSKVITLGTKVSAKDWAIIAAKIKESGLTVSEYLRASALSSTVNPPTLIPQINFDNWHDLARLGSNLNQIALQLHVKGVVNPYLTEVIEQIRSLLAEVRAALIQNGGQNHGV
jgi:hypothetical protein